MEHSCHKGFVAVLLHVLSHWAVLWSYVTPLVWKSFTDPGPQKISQENIAVGDTLSEDIPFAEKG